MKAIISSDWHLKFRAPFDRLTDRGIYSRLNEIITSVEWVIKEGKRKKATYFLGLGDIFDNADNLLTKEGLAIKSLFSTVSTAFPNKAYFIPGNHDQISSNHNILDLFSDTVTVFSSVSFVDVDGARLFFLPYIRESEDLYKYIEKIKLLDCPGKKYLFAHFWDKSTMSVDPEAIDLSKIDLSFFTRIFLGHYHVPTLNKTNKVIYVGTLLNKKFNETGPKGCWLLDTETDSLEFLTNPHSPEFFNLQDTNIIHDFENLVENGYYRVACDPENVLEINKLLSKVKGFELISKHSEGTSPEAISIMNIEKKNSSSFKEYILKNAAVYLPDGITLEEFKTSGESFLSGLL